MGIGPGGRGRDNNNPHGYNQYKHGGGGGDFASKIGGMMAGAVAAKRPAAPLASRRTSLKASWASGIRDRSDLAGGASGAKVELLTFNDGTQAVFKRAAKEKADRNMLYESTAEALGGRSAATTRVPGGMISEFISGEQIPEGHSTEDRKARIERMKGITSSDQARGVATADWLVGHTDRHGGNWVLTDSGPVAIDNDHAKFSPPPPERYDPGRNSWGSDLAEQFGGTPPPHLTPADVEQIAKDLAELRPEFEAAKRTEWHDNLMGQVGRLRRLTQKRG